jgi:hypothetical protein
MKKKIIFNSKKFNEIVKLVFIYLEILFFEYYINTNNESLISKNYFKSNKHSIMKKVLLSKISKEARRNLTDNIKLFLRKKGRFGNFFISINNAIIYCEFLCCQKIIVEYLNEIFINNTIQYKKYNLTIEPNKTINFKDKNMVILPHGFFFFNNFKYSRNVIKFGIFKRQFLNNLPKIVINPDDLYIYIRGGDIFMRYKHSIKRYPQPPLCFYMKILDEFKFREVIIISEDKLNPVIPELLLKYSYIKFKKNSLKLDIAYLANSFNIVGGKSSFLVTVIKFNDKLKNLWEYDFYQVSEKYLHLHSSVYKYPFHYKVYKMNPSQSYIKIMLPWLNKLNQRKMMLKEKCINNFYLIRERLINN